MSPSLHRPAGTLADGDLAVALSPDDAGWAYSGLTVVLLAPGVERSISLGQSEAVLLPLSAIAPDLVKPAAGIAILAAVGVTVQLLSMAMGNLRGVALYAKGERPGTIAFTSQAAMIFGHVGTIYTASGLLVRGEPIADAQLLIIAALYFTGTALAIHEWRRRRVART